MLPSLKGEWENKQIVLEMERVIPATRANPSTAPTISGSVDYAVSILRRSRGKLAQTLHVRAKYLNHFSFS